MRQRHRLIGASSLVLLLLLLYVYSKGSDSNQPTQSNVQFRHQSHSTPTPPTDLADSRRVPLRFSRTEHKDTPLQFACSIGLWANDDDDDDDDNDQNDHSNRTNSSMLDLIAILPVIDTFTHHINVFACDDSLDSFAFDQHDCCSKSCFFSLDGPCHTVVFLWDKGARPFHLPEPYGIRVGVAPALTRVLVQVHSLAVPSGLRRLLGVDLVYAPSLRTQPAHWFLFDDTALQLPAGVHNATTAAVLREGDVCDHLTGLDETLLLAVHLHMHTRGRRIALRWTDGDGNLHTLHRNDQYAGYGASQDVQWLDEPITLHHGGFLSVLCEYDTRNDTSPIHFGLRDTDEMCGAALLVSGPINSNSINFLMTTFG